MTKIEKINDHSSAIHTPVGVYAVSIAPTGMEWQNILSFDNKGNWESDPVTVMGKKIVPYGANNDLPVLIRRVMDENNLAPGILERQIGLLYGDGLALYKMKFENGEINREYVHDPEIDAWLKTWEFRRFIEMAMVEYKHLKGFFVRRFRNRGARLRNEIPKIAKLEVVSATDSRLEWPERSRRLEDVKHIFTGDFENNCFNSGIATNPVYDKNDPFKYEIGRAHV